MKKLKKILIIYTNSGAGHRRAAEALYQVVNDFFPQAQVQLFDALDYATPVFKKSYPQTYLFLVNYCPWLWGLVYYFLDIRFIDRISRIFRRVTNHRHCQKLEEHLIAEQPDLVLTTHFLPNEIISHMKKEGELQTFLVTCITDYYPHAFWRNRGIDLYITPNEALTMRLGKLGIAKDKIAPLGIPILPLFSEKNNQKDIRRQLGLNPEKFTILITSGGFGVGPIEQLVKEVNQIEQSLQILVICGNNPKLQAELTECTKDTHHQIKVFGFVGNMHELMDASNIIITKSGGLTTTEAMAKQLPLLVLYPIPGQESSNCEFIINHGAGMRAKNPKAARKFISNLLQNPEKIKELEKNLKKLGRPNAAKQIMELVKEKMSGK